MTRNTSPGKKLNIESYFADGGTKAVVLYKYGYFGYAVNICDARTGESIAAYPVQGSYTGVHINADTGELAYCESIDGQYIVRVLDLMTGEEKGALDVGSQTDSIRWSEDGEYMVISTKLRATFKIEPMKYVWRIGEAEAQRMKDDFPGTYVDASRTVYFIEVIDN